MGVKQTSAEEREDELQVMAAMELLDIGWEMPSIAAALRLNALELENRIASVVLEDAKANGASFQ